MFDNSQFFVSGAGGGFYPVTIDNSLRFEDGSTAHLTRTATAGNQQTFTWSGWIKRGNLTGAEMAIFGARVTEDAYFKIDAAETMSFYVSASNRTVYYGTVSTMVFRDPSAWYHIVLAVDTTQATAADRVKMYVNGELIARTDSFGSGAIPQNTNTSINAAVTHYIGRVGYTASSLRYDGYMAEVHFCDGTAYDATAFGEFKGGVWVAKSPAVTYGTNGFYLKFADSGALGTDSSGNGNTWTPTNLAATDQMLDSPTNNFAALSPLSTFSSPAFSEGNLIATAVTTGAHRYAYGTHGVSIGKWYFEASVTQGGTGGNCMFGVVDGNSITTSSTWYSASWGWAIDNNGNGTMYKRHNGTSTSLGPRSSASQILGCAIDLDNGQIFFSIDGVWIESSNPATNTNPAYSDLTGSVLPAVYVYSITSGVDVARLNVGQDSSFAGSKTRQGNTDANGIGDFYYTPPSGYLALCTANLPAPVATIDPNEGGSPEDHFNAVLYTGDDTNDRPITGVGFQPDLVWIKARSAAYGHVWMDSNRGAGLLIQSDSTAAETSYTAFDSFDTDGFTVSKDGLVGTNTSGVSYVAWCFKAGGAPVSNTDGTITSSVSANVDAGFSIVTYAGNSTTGQTVGHGLNAAPELVFIKNRTDAIGLGWITYSNQLTTNQYLLLNSSNAATTLSNVWTSATSTVFGPNGTHNEYNQTGRNYVAYCFHSVEGFSKIGTYVGNGSADGPYVHCGFRPAFVLYKRAVGGTGNWILADNAREGYNWDNPALYPNLNLAESGGSSIDILSNGFKVNNSVAGSDHNANGSTYLFMAIAEDPFKYSQAR